MNIARGWKPVVQSWLAAACGMALLLLPVQGGAGGEIKTIRVVMDDNYPPYVFKEQQGELKGIIVDQWRLWEKKTGIRVELEGMDWSEAQRRMQAGEFDVIDTIFYNEKRAKLYDFTKAYASIPVPLFFHADISGIRGPDDAKGFMVAAKAGGNVLDVLKKQGIINIVEYPSYEKIIEAARDGQIKVFTVDRPPALYYLNKMGLQDRFRETAPMYSGEFHRAVLKGNRVLRDAVERGFASVSPDEYRAIDKRWMGAPLGGQLQLRYLWYGAGVTAALAAVILVWLVMLRRAVRRKTGELAESEEHYRTIIENMQDVYYRTDAGGRLTIISPSGVELLGYGSADEMLGQVIRETFYHNPDERDAFVHNLKIKGHLYGYEVTLKRKDGSPVPVATSTHLMYSPDGSFIGVEGVFRDIARQKNDFEALAYSNECFQQALDSSQHMLYRLNVKKGCYDYMSPVFERITGYPLEPFMHTSLEKLKEYFHPDDRERVFALIEEKMAAHPGLNFNLDIEYRFRKADGSYCWLHDSNTACFDAQGELECFFGAAQDVTERKQTEALLRESEERYRLLVEQSTAWIWKTDAALRHTFSNDNVEKVLGYSVKELCDMDTLALVHPDDHEALRKVTGEAVSNRREWSGLVLRWKTREGGWRSIESSGRALFDEKGEFTGLQGVDTDITDHLQLEAEREKRQRLESLGLLAGGIAHDFNNILTGIIGNLSLARMMIDGGHRAAGRLEECEKAAQRAGELTRQLLTFARGGEPVKKIVELPRLVEEAVSFGLRGSSVKGVLELDDGLWLVNADEGQLNQVFNNLLINAAQAMPDGGTVTVCGENEITDGADGAPQRFVRLTIRDTGCGIPPDALPKVFDPYFTTKAHGSGLGLASVHSIVTRHGGTVHVSSEPGRGTEFAICLPAADKAVPQEQNRDVTGFDRSGAAHVLVMDDEPMIIDVLSMMLEELGCTFDACNDGSEAVKLFQDAVDRGKRYDIVILDLTVPGGMGGLETARRIKEIDPEAPLVVSSGYSQDAAMADYAGYGFCGQVKKPYSIGMLGEELGRVLQTRERSGIAVKTIARFSGEPV